MLGLQFHNDDPMCTQSTSSDLLFFIPAVRSGTWWNRFRCLGHTSKSRWSLPTVPPCVSTHSMHSKHYHSSCGACSIPGLAGRPLSLGTCCCGGATGCAGLSVAYPVKATKSMRGGRCCMSLPRPISIARLETLCSIQVLGCFSSHFKLHLLSELVYIRSFSIRWQLHVFHHITMHWFLLSSQVFPATDHINLLEEWDVSEHVGKASCLGQARVLLCLLCSLENSLKSFQ